MMKTITIRNFQKHKKIVLVLDPKVTTIVGNSDQGKTSIFRAVKWVAFNRPKGKKFIRNGSTKDCIVSIEIDNKKVVRRKGTVNEYQIDDKKLKAFGMDVPIPVKDVLKLAPCNFQNQFDGPFWFTLSSGQLVKELNKVVDLSLFDTMLSTIGKQVREKQIELKIHVQNQNELNAEIKKSKWIVPYTKEKERLDQQTEQTAELKIRTKRLKELLDEYNTQDNNWIDEYLADYEAYFQKRWKRDQFAERVRMLYGLISEYDELAQEEKRWESELSQVEKQYQKTEKQSRKCPTCGQSWPLQSPTSISGNKGHEHGQSRIGWTSKQTF